MHSVMRHLNEETQLHFWLTHRHITHNKSATSDHHLTSTLQHSLSILRIDIMPMNVVLVYVQQLPAGSLLIMDWKFW